MNRFDVHHVKQPYNPGGFTLIQWITPPAAQKGIFFMHFTMWKGCLFQSFYYVTIFWKWVQFLKFRIWVFVCNFWKEIIKIVNKLSYVWVIQIQNTSSGCKVFLQTGFLLFLLLERVSFSVILLCERDVFFSHLLCENFISNPGLHLPVSCPYK